MASVQPITAASAKPAMIITTSVIYLNAMSTNTNVSGTVQLQQQAPAYIINKFRDFNLPAAIPNGSATTCAAATAQYTFGSQVNLNVID